ncbi:MAG: aldo/keto reductase [bacterium]|nr:aldo/keto reductase [bacterium]
MQKSSISRRNFIGSSALVAGAGAAAGSAGAAKVDASNTRSYNPDMEYRRLGKTGLMISAVALGGHWKRMNQLVPGLYESRWLKADLNNTGFIKNRDEVISRSIERGINYVDACTGAECITYSRALKGRRDKMFLGWSWYEKEARFEEWRSTKKLMQSLDDGLKAAGQEYVDLWRITSFSNKVHTPRECEWIVEALAKAKKQGKARFTGVSSHNRPWLTMLIQEYPNEFDAIATPYTAASKVLPKDSLFDTVQKCDVGVFGIKPFASNSLFEGDGTTPGALAEEDNRRARLAIRYILANPAITAPIPGLISVEQVDNVALAITEHRQAAQLDLKETSELAMATDRMWERLPSNYQWLKDWEYV